MDITSILFIFASLQSKYEYIFQYPTKVSLAAQKKEKGKEKVQVSYVW